MYVYDLASKIGCSNKIIQRFNVTIKAIFLKRMESLNKHRRSVACI